ncbi:MAG TPA: AIM24 family protein [Caulobacteraceae bacterium]|jgi:uncharacterized protein (AIM24 family)|nr:AIM24 family protein [Caulobacteraceae bacterium]
MVALPRLIPAKAKVQTFGDIAYHIGAEAAPVLTVDVSRASVYFPQRRLLWKHPSVKVTVRPPNGGYKPNALATQALIADARGPGMIAFSGDGPGRVVPIHLRNGRRIEVSAHQFLAASEKVARLSTHMRGPPDLHNGGSGYTIDRFECSQEDGVLWLFAYGQVFEKSLEDGESIDIEPHAWLFKDSSMRMEPQVDRFSSGPFGGHANLVVNRFTGPGVVAVQSMARPRLDA